ncbi:MAG: hypothetical protein IAE82_01125 [Opitutaceae bacterium]|nr:hypothetical protein [Opitutaceae bacterium]
MKTRLSLFLATAALAAAAIVATSGCTSDYSGGGDVDVHGSFYYGVGYGPGFYGSPYYGYPPPAVVVTPPNRPPGGSIGGGPRPTPMPSMPAARPRR